jgi:hypothetical protein
MNENVAFTNGKFGTHNARVHSVLATVEMALISWRLENIENRDFEPNSIVSVQTPDDQLIMDHVPLIESDDILYITPNRVAVFALPDPE